MKCEIDYPLKSRIQSQRTLENKILSELNTQLTHSLRVNILYKVKGWKCFKH